MAPTRQSVLRTIAEADLQTRFGSLPPSVLHDLATSLARQWLTNDGHAGHINQGGHYWFRLVRKGDGFEVGCHVDPPWFVNDLRRLGIDEKEIGALLYELCLCQCAVHMTDTGVRLRMSMVPRERTYEIKEEEE
jgi:hypothetical protein